MKHCEYLDKMHRLNWLFPSFILLFAFFVFCFLSRKTTKFKNFFLLLWHSWRYCWDAVEIFQMTLYPTFWQSRTTTHFTIVTFPSVIILASICPTRCTFFLYYIFLVRSVHNNRRGIVFNYVFWSIFCWLKRKIAEHWM